jgi:hypothetical protein
MADLFFLIVMGVIAIFSAQDDRACILGVAEFTVRPLTAFPARKSGGFQFRNQLTDLSRHNLPMQHRSLINGRQLFSG